MRQSPAAPRHARKLLEWALPPDCRDAIVGDLEEVFLRRARERGAFRARWWYVLEALAFATRFGFIRMWTAISFGDFRAGLTQVVRRLARRPGFAATVVFTLALGIGANVAVFEIFEAVHLRALPVSDPGRLVLLELGDMERWEGRRVSRHPVLSNPLWEAVRDGDGPLESALAWAAADFRLGASGGAEPVRGLFVSGDYFHVLGVTPAAGRMLRADDDVRGCGLPGAVLSHGFWLRAFGGDASIVGREIMLDGAEVPVLGVSREGFAGLESDRPFDVAVPICSQATLGAEEGWLADGTTWWLTVFGRLPGNRSLEAVNTELEAWSPSLFRSTLPAGYPSDRLDNYLGQTLRAAPGGTGVSSLRAEYGDALMALMAVTFLILLIVVANLANLFLARTSGRRLDFAVRRALGAPRTRLVQELLTESALLGAAGAALGVGLAVLLGRNLAAYLGTGVTLDLSPGVRTWTFIVLLSGLCAVACGLLPGWRMAREATARLAVGSAGRGSAGASHGMRLRQGLVVAQVALSFVVVFAALAFVGTLRSLIAVDVGFETTGVTVARVDFEALDASGGARTTLLTDLLERLRGVSGVTSAAEVRHVPLGGTGSSITVGAEASDPSGRVTVRANAVTRDYFQTMQIPLLEGRRFDSGDAPEALLAIVNPTFLSRIGSGSGSVGERFYVEELDRTLEIVGVVPDTKYFSLREDPLPIVFVQKALLGDSRPYTDFVIRSSLEPATLGEAVRSLASSMSSEIWIDLYALDENVEGALVPERVLSALAGFFAVLAMLVAAIGLYGVMSQLVGQRRGEIGVRIALGADRGTVFAMVLGRGGVLVGAGLALGALLATAASRALRSVVFGLGSSGAGAMAVAAALLALTAAAACYLPARRAAGLDPTEAFRAD